jgi:hypothetical protein
VSVSGKTDGSVGAEISSRLLPRESASRLGDYTFGVDIAPLESGGLRDVNRLVKSTATMLAKKVPSKVPAPPIEAIGTPRP